MAIPENEKADLLDASLAASFYAKYEIKNVLGTGASSTVRRCISKETKDEFAVKILDLNSGAETAETLLAECMREVSILRAVANHKHIIKLIDVFQGDAFVFLVFELCNGGELFDYLTKKVALSEKRTRIIMRQLLDAVAFIHTKGIVHRDLKPENILLDQDLNVKISDFGLAVYITDKNELIATRGTPGYLAPEVLRVGYYDSQPPYGQPVDIWACGVVMYTLLVGFPPFWHRKEYLMLRQIMSAEYSFPSPEWDEISEQSKDLIRKMLTADSVDRIKAKEVILHEFFEQGIPTVSNGFNARKVFRAAFHVISFIDLLKKMRVSGKHVSINTLKRDPYSDRRLRKLIDVLAYDVYSHWIKKATNQNRAALFQNCPTRQFSSSSNRAEAEKLLRMDTLEGTGEEYDFTDYL